MHLVHPSVLRLCGYGALWRRRPLVLPAAAAYISPLAQAEMLTPLSPSLCSLFLLSLKGLGLALEQSWCLPPMVEALWPVKG